MPDIFKITVRRADTWKNFIEDFRETQTQLATATATARPVMGFCLNERCYPGRSFLVWRIRGHGLGRNGVSRTRSSKNDHCVTCGYALFWTRNYQDPENLDDYYLRQAATLMAKNYTEDKAPGHK